MKRGGGGARPGIGGCTYLQWVVVRFDVFCTRRTCAVVVVELSRNLLLYHALMFVFFRDWL